MKSKLKSIMFNYKILGPNLPRPMSGHCMEIINKSSLFVFDPNSNSEIYSQTFIYDFNAMKWDNVKDKQISYLIKIY